MSRERDFLYGKSELILPVLVRLYNHCSAKTMKMPEHIKELIARHHAGGVSERDCIACSSGCCSQGGFAILENVLQIYELYRKGKLKRRGYRFPRGLSFRDFVFMHFDVWSRPVGPKREDKEMVFFHMRSVDEKGRPIGVPGGGGYWKIRSELFNQNPWLNWGCVFLSHKCPNWPEDDRLTKRHCILHTAGCRNAIGPKPIDCVFYTCTKPYESKIPAKEVTEEWFSALSEAFPDSVKRFQDLTGGAEQGSGTRR